MTNNSTSNI